MWVAGAHGVTSSFAPLLGHAASTEPRIPGDSATAKRARPTHPLVLRTGDLEMELDAQSGLPYSYKFNGEQLWGEDNGMATQAIFCQLSPRKYTSLVPTLISTQNRPGGEATFQFCLGPKAQPYVTYALHYAAEGSSLQITLDSVVERPGFELIEVGMPKLMTIRQEDGPAWMAEGRNGGSYVSLADAKPYRFDDDDYFGRISFQLPVGILGNQSIGCIMEVTAYMDGTETEITGAPGKLHATMGCTLSHRVHGGRCYGMNDGGDAVCGTPTTPNLLIEQKPLTRLDFFRCKAETQPWLPGAKIMQSRMPPLPTDYLSNRFLYIVAGKRKIDAEPKTTFRQSKQLIQDIAHLTDQAPQVAFISGFAYDGQDTGFPSEDKINSSLGTDEELLSLIQFGKRINANVTLNVNYDDAYKSSPLFDEAFIARRPDNKIWKSRAWDGEDSYVVGMAKYMEGGWGSKRIAFTVDHFKITGTILIDAMSWFAVRNDWDHQHPASGYKNLIDGKFQIIDQFRKRGVAVTSEQLRYPMIGKLTESMDGPGVSSCPFGGEAIPLLATIYRGSAIWGGTGDGSIHPGRELFWNTRSALWFQADSDRTRATDFYYLVTLPYSKLHRLTVQSYVREGATRKITLTRDSQVQMTGEGDSYVAKYEGVEIARDNATFCPIDENRIACYSKTAKRLRYPLPAAWSQDKVVARTLGVHGRTPSDVKIVAGTLEVEVLPNMPVIVYANEADIPQTAA